MKAEEIRNAYLEMMAALKKADNAEMMLLGHIPVVALMITEIAEKMAEINEHLIKIANPLLVVDAESPWVQLSWRGRSCVVHRDDVSAVFQYGTSKTESVVVRRGDVGDDAGHCCEMPLSELCAKLKIPFKEPS